MATQLITYMDGARFDTRLAVGQRVLACWTSCGCAYEAPAEISKVNRKSVRAKLLKAVDEDSDFGGYPEGHELVIPRFRADRWSQNNCVTAINQ